MQAARAEELSFGRGFHEYVEPTQVLKAAKKWVHRSICCVTIIADRISEAVGSVDGLSALVRVATSVSHAVATIAERFSLGTLPFARFTQAEFAALVDSTAIFADPAYFLCGDACDDMKKGRVFWVVGVACSAVVNFAYFALWMKSYGRDAICNAFDRLTQTRAFKWTRVVSATTMLGLLSIGASGAKCVQRMIDLCNGEPPVLSIVDGLAWAFEMALSASEMLPFCGPITTAGLGVAAAGLGIASYFIDISLEAAEKKVSA